MLPSFNGVELVTCTKLLGVWIQDNLKADMHADYIGYSNSAVREYFL